MNELDELKTYEKMLKGMIAKRLRNTEELIMDTFDSVCTAEINSAKETKKDIFSFRNIALQVERMMAISDNITFVKHSQRLETLMSKCVAKVKYYGVQEQEENLIKCKPTLTEKLLHHNFSLVFMKETEKKKL